MSSSRSRPTKGRAKASKSHKHINLDNVADGILAILETPEILNLIEEDGEIVIEVIKPLLKSPNTLDITSISDADNMIDLTSCPSDIAQKINTIHNTGSRYRKEVLNGIYRKTDIRKNRSGCEYCYEERYYLVTDSNAIPWVVRIENRCSSDLIPIIVDYDQDLEITEYVYDSGVRKIVTKPSNSTEAQTRYEISEQLDTSIVTEGEIEEAQEEILKSLRRLDRTYANIFE